MAEGGATQKSKVGVDEFHFHKLLSDEQLRSERHKMNYETLKLDHQRLQKEYAVLQTQNTQLLDEKRHIQESNMQALQRSQQELIQTKTLIDELKHKVELAPSRTELQRIKAIEDIQQKYAEVLMTIEDENLSCRSQYHKLFSEYNLLKSEYERKQIEMANDLDEIKRKHENEMTVLKKEKNDLEKALINDKSHLTDMITSLQKEKLKLTHRLYGVTHELQEANLFLQQLRSETTTYEKQNTTQIAQLTEMVKALNLEKATLSKENRSLQQNVQDLNAKSSELKGQLSDLTVEAKQMKQKLNEAETKATVEIANFKTILSKRKSEFEEDLQLLIKHIQERAMKESELQQHWHTVHQEDMKNLMKLEEEKQSLNFTCQKFKNRLLEANREKDQEIVKLKSRFKTLNEGQLSLEKEKDLLRGKLLRHDELVEELTKKETELGDLRSQLTKMRRDLQVMCDVESQLVASNQELNSAIKLAHKQLLSYKNHEHRTSQYRNFKRQESKWKKERQELKSSILKMRQQIKTLTHKMNSSRKLHKVKTTKYSKLIVKLRNKIQLQHAKLLEMDTENKSLKNFVPGNVHTRVKRKLHELQRQREDFRRLLQNYHLFGGEAVISALGPIWNIKDVQQQRFVKSLQDHLLQISRNKVLSRAEFELKAAGPS